MSSSSRRGPLYHRHLERFDSTKEGAFLAATLWVAHYWVLRRDFARARSILDAVLGYANDLGLWSEEADHHTSQALGNFPQTITHAAFISAVLELRRLERISLTATVVRMRRGVYSDPMGLT